MQMEEKRYSMVPRVGTRYSESYGNAHILVLGAYHSCSYVSCPNYSECILNRKWRDYDSSCPEYRKNVDLENYKYRLSNANIIEIDSFVEDGGYPSYSIFTYFMKGKSDVLLEEDKESFWENVAFYNYIQDFLPDKTVLDPELDREWLESYYPALEDVLMELKPCVVYVWNTAIKEILMAHRKSNRKYSFRYVTSKKITGLTVYMFNFYLKSEAGSRENLDVYSRSCYSKARINRYIGQMIGRESDDFTHLAHILHGRQAGLRKNAGRKAGYVNITPDCIEPADDRFSSLYDLIIKMKQVDEKAVLEAGKESRASGISGSCVRKPLKWKDFDKLFGKKAVHSLLLQHAKRK